MKNLYFIVLLLLFTNLSNGQITVKGQVVGAQTNERIMASISWDESTYGSITDYDGFFEIEIKDYNTSILITAEGYQNKKIVITEPSTGLLIKLDVGYGEQSSFIFGEDIESNKEINFIRDVDIKVNLPLIKEYYPSIVRINAQKYFGEDIGTGIIIGNNGQDIFILTAFHVVDKSSNNEVLIYRQKEKIAAELILKNEELDLAILKINVQNTPDFKTFHLAHPRLLKTLRPVISVGHPAGGFWKLNPLNEIQETELYEENRQFSITPQAIVGGCSGGPVFLENGTWVGLVTETSMIEGKCVKAGSIQKWVRENNIPSQYIYYPEVEMIFVKGNQQKKKHGLSFVTDDLKNLIESPNETKLVKINDFYLAKNELTVAQFEAFIMATNYKTSNEKNGITYILKKDENYDGETFLIIDTAKNITYLHDSFGKIIKEDHRAKFPVIHISWTDASAYCKWISLVTGKQYRLPYQEEYYYVQMPSAFTKKQPIQRENVYDLSTCEYDIYSPYHDSNYCMLLDVKLEEYDKSIFYNDGFPTISPIGQFPEYDLGFNDLFGNVSEWCNRQQEISLRDRPSWGGISFGPNWIGWTWNYLLGLHSENEIWITDVIAYENSYLPNKKNTYFNFDRSKKIKKLGFMLTCYSNMRSNPKLGLCPMADGLENHISTCYTGFRLARD